MGRSRFKKIFVLSHEKFREPILRAVQETGAVHIDKTEQAAVFDESRLIEVNQTISHLKYCIDFLQEFQLEKRVAIEMFIELDHRRPVSGRERSEAAAKALSELNSICERCREFERRLGEVSARKHFLLDLREKIKEFAFIEAPVESVGETSATIVQLLEFKKSEFKRFQENQKKARYCAVQIVGLKKNSVVALVAVLKGFEKELQEYSFVAVQFPEVVGLKGTPRQLMEDLGKQATESQDREAAIKRECEDFARAQLPLLYCAFDEMLSEKEKIEASRKFSSTQHTFLIKGWIKEGDLKRVRVAIEKAASGVCEILFEDPAPGDNPPVELQNPSFLKPFEIITHGFGLPSYFEQDPTPILAPFFFVFTGLCLTDAGYGVVLALLSLVLWFKYKELRNFFALLILIGVSTVVFGALIGGWFGGLLPIKPLWFDSMNNPLAFLAIAFALGFIHLVVGLIIELYDSLKQKHFFSAFADQFLWISLLLSIALFALAATGVIPASAREPIIFAAGGSAFGLVLTQGRHEKNVFKKLFSGVLSLYGLIGYFSDVLSYSRLLALGLATGVIAMIVNELAKIGLSMFGLLGIVIAAAILVVGHFANLVLSALGAYIHSLRLQYVEFFPKFFSGGGERFNPLSPARVYTKMLREPNESTRRE